jgi:hypothetical protein
MFSKAIFSSSWFPAYLNLRDFATAKSHGKDYPLRYMVSFYTPKDYGYLLDTLTPYLFER